MLARVNCVGEFKRGINGAGARQGAQRRRSEHGSIGAGVRQEGSSNSSGVGVGVGNTGEMTLVSGRVECNPMKLGVVTLGDELALA